MASYFKIDIDDKIVTFPERLDPDLYENIGTTWEDYCNGLWIELSDEQLKFSVDNPEASVEEIFNANPVEKRSNEIEKERFKKKCEIMSYDHSSDINSFLLNGDKMWFNKQERSNLLMRFNAEKQAGATYTRLWFNGKSYALTVENAIILIYAVEIYASKCYDITQEHLYNISNKNNLKDIENYDYMSGYPGKLSFNYA